jgi:hypothetical protein
VSTVIAELLAQLDPKAKASHTVYWS